ncbi:MAG: 6-bladed beta-propeller [Longimicrobiales bacterium]
MWHRPFAKTYTLRVLALVLGTACGDAAREPGARGGWRADIDTVGDTIVVTTLGGTETREAHLVEEFRIGSVEGADHQVFGDITALAANEAGEVFVYDAQAVALRRYGADGRYIGTIGGPGAGPGEYQNVAGLAVLEDGRIVVHDFGNARYNVYTADGEILTTWLLRPAVADRRPLYPDGSGGVFLHDRRLVGGESTREEILVAVGETGELGDTILIPHAEYRPPGLEVRTERFSVGTFVPFTPTREWSVTANGELVTMSGTRYALDVHRRDGRVVRISREIDAVPVSLEERVAEEERVTARFRRVVPGWRWDGPPIPEFKPPIRWIHTGADTTIWVAVAAPGRAVPDSLRLRNARSWVVEPLILDVFRPDGRFLGRVNAPPEMQLSPHPAFSRDHVWAVVIDENGVHFVSRFRIVRP